MVTAIRQLVRTGRTAYTERASLPPSVAPIRTRRNAFSLERYYERSADWPQIDLA